jgi:hypothetical protein
VTGGGITISACPEFDVPADQQQMEMTMRWLAGRVCSTACRLTAA